jgi:GDP-L-fucose synthase
VRSGGGADQVTIWGSGTPRREFLHVDDRADACLFLLEHYEAEMPINVGSGFDVTILELAQLIARATGFSGRFEFDRTKPDGTPTPRIELASGIEATCNWYRAQTRLSSAPLVMPVAPVAAETG